MQKLITHLTVWFSKEVFHGFLPFLFEWQKFKTLIMVWWLAWFSNWSPKCLWHNWLWSAIAKITCYWFLKTYCKLVYLSKKSILVNLGNSFSKPASVFCGVHQGSVLGPLLFLVYVNDMSQAVKCHLFLCANNSCFACQHKEINEIGKQLNVDFSNICDWFEDNK